MSTDPAFTVEWTVPTAETEWGGDGPRRSSSGVDPDTDADVGPNTDTETDPGPDGDADPDDDVGSDDAEPVGCTTSERDRDRPNGRDPANLPPAPVLAARVDRLRSERDAAEGRVEAVRDRYERELAARNEEIRELRASRSRLRAVLDRVRDLF